MVTACSITVQSLLKIVQRAAAVGAKIWCLYVFFGFYPRNVYVSAVFGMAKWLAGWVGV